MAGAQAGRVLDDGKCIDCLAAFGESGDDSPSQETLARPNELAEDAVKRGRPSQPVVDFRKVSRYRGNKVHRYFTKTRYEVVFLSRGT